MCVAVLAWQAHPRWRLVVAANRDEFHERPTAPLARWSDGTIAGRDLQAGGTWLGLNAAGRLALVTNFRLPGYPRPDLASRGGPGLLADIPLGRVATPEEIAAIIAFCALDAPESMTGAVIDANGASFVR